LYFSVRFSRWLLCYFTGGYGTDVSLTYERTVHTSSITITRPFLPPASDPSQARTALTPASCGVLHCEIPFSFSKGSSIIVVRIFNKFPFDLCSASPCSPLLPRCRLPRLQTLVEVLCAFSLAARPATAVVDVSVALGNARTFANVAPGKHRWYALWLGRANDGRVPCIVYGGVGIVLPGDGSQVLYYFLLRYNTIVCFRRNKNNVPRTRDPQVQTWEPSTFPPPTDYTSAVPPSATIPQTRMRG
jgi:hypothetical protein